MQIIWLYLLSNYVDLIRIVFFGLVIVMQNCLFVCWCLFVKRFNVGLMQSDKKIYGVKKIIKFNKKKFLKFFFIEIIKSYWYRFLEDLIFDYIIEKIMQLSVC